VYVAYAEFPGTLQETSGGRLTSSGEHVELADKVARNERAVAGHASCAARSLAEPHQGKQRLARRDDAGRCCAGSYPFEDLSN